MQQGSGRLRLFRKIKKGLAMRMRNVQVVDIDAIQIILLTTCSHGFSNNLSYSGSFQMAIGASQPTNKMKQGSGRLRLFRKIKKFLAVRMMWSILTLYELTC